MLINLLNDLKNDGINVIGLAPEEYKFKRNEYDYFKILIITDEGIFSELVYYSEDEMNDELNEALDTFNLEEL